MTRDYTGCTDAELLKRHYALRDKLRAATRAYNKLWPKFDRLQHRIHDTAADLIAVDLERASRL